MRKSRRLTVIGGFPFVESSGRQMWEETGRFNETDVPLAIEEPGPHRAPDELHRGEGSDADRGRRPSRVVWAQLKLGGYGMPIYPARDHWISSPYECGDPLSASRSPASTRPQRGVDDRNNGNLLRHDDGHACRTTVTDRSRSDSQMDLETSTRWRWSCRWRLTRGQLVGGPVPHGVTTATGTVRNQGHRSAGCGERSGVEAACGTIA